MAGKFGKFKMDDIPVAGVSTPLVPGRYLVKVLEHDDSKKSSGGFYQVITSMEVLQGPPQADGSLPAKRRVVDYLTFNRDSEDNMRISMGVLKSLLLSAKVKMDANDDWNKKKVIGAEIGVELTEGKANKNKPNAPVYPRVRCYFDPDALKDDAPSAPKKGKGKKAKADDDGWDD